MPPVDFTESKYHKIVQHALDVLNSEQAKGKYLTVVLFADLLAEQHGIVVRSYSLLESSLVAALKKTCPYTLSIPASVEYAIIRDTCNAMVPSGIAGFIKDLRHRILFFFSNISDMMMFRLLLPPLEI